MAIRPHRAGFQVDVTVKGVRAPRVTCPTLAEAKATEAQFKAHLMAGGHPAFLAGAKDEAQKRRSCQHTLGELIDATYAAQWRDTKGEQTAMTNANSWATALGYDFAVTAIGPDEVTRTVDEWASSGLTAATINRKIAALSVMLNVAEERGWIDKKIKLRRKKEYEGRLRYYTDDEVDSLLDFVSDDEDMKALFFLAVETGMRQGELLGLTRRDINGERGLIMLGETKGNKRRSVPLTEAAKPVVTRLMRDKAAHERLFPANFYKQRITRTVRSWKAKQGLPASDEACFHTFRHTTCSRLIMAGVNPVVVQKWMGHASIQTTMRYIHLAPDALDSALVALNSRKGNQHD